LNPIEQVFAKFKHLMRKAAERTIETTWKHIGKLLDGLNQTSASDISRTQGALQPKLIPL
jgi:transposase